ncbi:hypothetical protein PMAYCL1PPCAC_27846, partial [Pristionchus mayeri]
SAHLCILLFALADVSAFPCAENVMAIRTNCDDCGEPCACTALKCVCIEGYVRSKDGLCIRNTEATKGTSHRD